MSCNQLPVIPNPIPISQKIYGKTNVNEVRDATVNSLRRFYGTFCNINNVQLYGVLQQYMVKILVDAGRNPKAVKLAIPPEQLQLNIFPKHYIQSSFDKDKALLLSYDECKCLPNGVMQKEMLNCFIDYHSV